MSTLSRDDILAALSAIEPNLVKAAESANESDASTIEEFADHADPRVRANAITLLSLVNQDAFWRAFPKAAADADALVRIQAVRALENYNNTDVQKSTAEVNRLLRDRDAGVKKFSVRVAARLTAASVREALQEISATAPEPFLRQEATQALRGNR